MNDFNGLPPKQINRVATPIRVNEMGEKIEERPQIVEKKNVEKKSEHDSQPMVFITLLLIILAILCFFVFYIIVPRYIASKDEVIEYNDATTTTTKRINNEFTTMEINNNQIVNFDSSFVIDNNYQISTISNGSSIDILVNNKKITTANYLLPLVGRVDDLIIISVQNSNARTTKLYSVDKSGNVVLELYNVGNIDGMVLLPDISSTIYNSVTLVVLTSRVNNNSLIINNNFGELSGLNICDENSLLENKLNDNSIALATYSIEYIGDHKFSTPAIINSVTIDEYKKSKNICN